MMISRVKWRVIFLGTILAGLLAFLGLELKAIFDTNDNTEALTTIISRFVPDWIFFSALAAVTGWTGYNFIKEYNRRHSKK